MQFLIVTGRNVMARLFVGAMLILAGLQLMQQPPRPNPTAVLVGLLVLLLGCTILFFGLRWFWRLYIKAWFI